MCIYRVTFNLMQLVDGKTIYEAKANEKTMRISEEVMQRDGELRAISANYDNIREDGYKSYYQVDEDGEIIIGRDGQPLRKGGEVYTQDQRTGEIMQTR